MLTFAVFLLKEKRNESNAIYQKKAVEHATTLQSPKRNVTLSKNYNVL
ncbi:hypothetical protein EVA_12138 [gut metagenome]|uniref:Uncharacterized protein n=1 Tax=gut metagenome TaxID=749906 RepID=J9FXP9_9ZZZZ